MDFLLILLRITNNPRDVEYFPSVVQKGELNPGGFTWFAQGQAAFAPNSLLEVQDHTSTIRAFPGGKSGLEAQGIPGLCWGRRGSSPAGTLGKVEMQFPPSHAVPCAGGRGTLLMVRSSQKWEGSWFGLMALLILPCQRGLTKREF